jgi:isocitrate dehydrogenase kinase/phosphatase
LNLAERIASRIVDGFDRHYRRFRALSASAKGSFERGDWRALHEAGRQRIGSYDAHVAETVALIRSELAEAADETVWRAVKRATTMRLLELDHQQPELAETFYNSVACRVLARTYYNNEYLFWRQAVSTDHIDSLTPTYRVYYPAELGLRQTLRTVVGDLHLVAEWEDLERDLREVVRRLGEFLPSPSEIRPSLQLHVLSSLFFRGQAAYLIGRLRNDPDERAFAVPIRKNEAGQLYLDAFLAGHDELVQLFTLTRAYFLVDMEVPAEFVAFLRGIFPTRSTAELYTSLGLQKQGKTLFYRELDFHLKNSKDLFVIAPGVKGMVMCVFTLPSFPWVFKVIRDEFDAPKDSDRQEVKRQYTRVKMHDRVGRMADTWEYSDVALPLNRFAPELLEELERKVPSLLSRVGERLVIEHVYIQRRLIPLDVHLAKAPEERRLAAVADFGNAIRELARVNLFPGDMLMKNFGITRLGRVVFYDYDEISPVTSCKFRRMPTPRHDDEEYSNDWVSVGPRDIFPEELPRFIFSDPELRAAFLELHGDLATPEWWMATQRAIEAGASPETRPYPEHRCFRRR